MFPPAIQWPRLLEFRQAIDARQASLRRDDCGDWAVSGRAGHVYAVPEGFQLYVATGERPLKWTWIKKKLGFCRVTQDGDDEGCLILDRLPTVVEAELIREALGIRKARSMSEEGLAKLISYGEKGRFKAEKTAKSGAPATMVPEPELAGSEP
jgi:hypothetical protein